MSTSWKSTNKPNNTFTGTTISSWSRQQKLAIIATLTIIGVLLAISACSKQSEKPALAGVSSQPSNTSTTSTASQMPAAQTASSASPALQTVAKKTPKKHPANVSYKDANSGVSFVYPRKFTLATGDKAQPQLENNAVPMNFVQPGGVTVAAVTLPETLYPGTDFATGFFSVSVNRSLSEEQCSHFAFVDTRNADGEPIDAEKVKVGTDEMEMTSEFAGSATKQAETQYYHNYENGACYEYVLGLGTAGYGMKEGLEPVNRDDVFARLEKILATVKIHPGASEPTVESASVAGAESAK